jgi:peptidyl-prolyl cis-trans isomerase C
MSTVSTFSRFSRFVASVAVIGAGLHGNPALAADPKPATPKVEAKAQKTNPDEVAAVFNGREIKVAELDAEIERKPAFAMFQNMGAEDPALMNRVRLAALNGIINRELLLGAARSSGVISEPEVAASVEKFVANYGGKQNLSSLVDKIGSTYEKFTAEIADDFRITSFIDKVVAKDVKVAAPDIEAAFKAQPEKYAQSEKVHVSHILIKAEPDASPEKDKAALDKINELYKKATAPGADFAAIAKGNSECPSASSGGDLGEIDKGKTVPAFEQTAFSLKKDEISKPVRTQFGYHIVKLHSRTEAEKADLNKVKPMIEQELLQQKKVELVEKKVNELRTQAKITINLKQG